jgi:hypothetical protein
VPPDETTSVPPLDTVVLIAVPALSTTCDPAKIAIQRKRPQASSDEDVDAHQAFLSRRATRSRSACSSAKHCARSLTRRSIACARSMAVGAL